MPKRKTTLLFRRTVNLCLIILLLLLMNYQVTGEALHEWIGISMTIVLIIHHILNHKWYGALFRGKYNPYRMITTVVNTLLLVSIVLTAISGMSMSTHAVPFLYGLTGMVFAHTAHLAFSYWSFILIGLHLGLHLPAITAKIRPGKKAGRILTMLFTAIAAAGLWLFIRNGIPGYLTFRTHFAFFDYDKTAALVFLETLAELFCFIFIGANIVRLIRRRRQNPGG